MKLYQQDRSASWLMAAWRSSEGSRARSLMDMLNEGQVELAEGVSQELLGREREIQQRLIAKFEVQTRLLSGKHSPEQAESIAHEIVELINQEREIKGRIRATNPKYAHLTQPQPLTLAETQQQLDASTLLLQYALGEERSFVWAVAPDSINGFDLPARREIEATVERLTNAVAKRNLEVKDESVEQWRRRISEADAEFANASAALTKLVIDPVASLLGNKRLVIVADGALQRVSFGALPAPKLTGGPSTTEAQKRKRRTTLNSPRVLLEDHEIVYEPSASVLAVQRRELENRKPASQAVVVLANPVFDKDDSRVRAAIAKAGGRPAAATIEVPSSQNPNEGNGNRKDLTRALDDLGISRFRPLPLSRNEAEAIRSVASKAGFVTLKLDFDANRSTAMSKELSKYRYVHFATHGVVDFEHPELSGIVLSTVDDKGQDQNGYLRLHDIYNLNLPAELVVLSACQTGVGKQIKGEGLIALTRGFMYAGSRRVVASLWKVDDAATAALMSEFYKQMFTNKLAPAAALRTAQINLSRQRARRSPYYWAGFALQGEWK